MGQRFRPAMRIRRRPDFLPVLKRGKKRRSRYFTLHIMPRGAKLTRLGVIASRRTGKAVDRSRAKRLLREVFRRLHGKLPPGLDLVAVAKGPIAKAKLKDVESAFRGAVGLGED